MPIIQNATIWVGASGTLENEAGLVIDTARREANVSLYGARFAFYARGVRAADGTATALMSKVSGLTLDSVTGLLTVPISVEDSRQFIPGRAARYEIELRRGTEQRLFAHGLLLVQGGDNGDDDLPPESDPLPDPPPTLLGGLAAAVFAFGGV